ncbi:MAG TPA: CHAD domain-containing protein [Microlunatus sp.]|nr:CHAD domain-containing protein [Microlunatus sp.]
MPDTTPETVGDLVRAYLVEQCTVLIDAESALRDREAVVHPTRVAARRLRSTLRTYVEVVDVARAGTLSDELSWFAGLLGEIRDREVLESRLLDDLEALAPELVVGPVARQISEELTAGRSAAWDVVESELDSDRYRRLLAELHRWHGDAPLTKAAKAPAAGVKKYVKRANKKLDKRLDRAIEAHLSGDPETDDLLHQARKAGKRARYAVELAAPVLGKKADKLVAARKDLQDVLGEHQDSIVAADFLRTEGVRVGLRSGHNGFTYGLLFGGELARQAAIGEQLRPFLS